MRKLVLSVLFGLAVSLALAAVALAKEYVINVIVDGKTVVLSVVVEDDTLIANTQSPGATVVSVTEADAVAPTQPATTTATATRNANLRGGPGTTYPVVGGVRTGQALTIVGRNQAGDWLQVADDKWIAASLVNNAPVVGIAENALTPTQPTPQEPTPTTPPAATPTIAPTPTKVCDPSYPTLCIPPNSPDLDCPDISVKRFPVLPPDPHRFDGDNDGVGCES
jgi:uncharacterized protein YraI